MRLLPLLLLAVLTTATSEAADMLYRWKDADGVVHYTDTPPPAEYEFQTREVTTDPPQPPPSVVVEDAPVALSRCEQARRNLAVFESAQNVSMDLDGDGRPEPLDAAARERERKKTRDLVNVTCTDPG